MERNNIEQIEKLLERFFAGVTSNEEERELSHFFSEEEIPDELMPYKSLFAYLDTELEQEFLQLESEALLSEAEVAGLSTEEEPLAKIKLHRPKKRGVRLQRLLIGSAAALLLIFMCVASYNVISRNNFDPYEGSFIIRDGVKITDLNRIRPELEATMERVLYKEHKAEIEYLQMEYEQQAKYMDFINSFPEGPVREEIIKTLLK